jgi:hypothetical protein
MAERDGIRGDSAGLDFRDGHRREAVVRITGPAAVRIMISIFGWAVSLLVLSAGPTAAWAGPILIEQPAALPVSEFPIHHHNEQTRPANSNKLNPVFILNPSGDVRFQHSANDDDDSISAHDIAVATYYAIYDINSGVADDLLTSYRTISRVGGDIIAAIKAPLNAIGLSNDLAITQAALTAAAFADKGENYNDYVIHRSDLDKIIMRIRLIFSLDYLPYYILVLGAYVLFTAFRAAFRAHFMRHSYRDRDAPLRSGAPSAFVNDGNGALIGGGVDRSMPEMAYPGEDHRDAGGIGGGDHFGVAARAAGLDRGDGAGADRRFEAVGERVERVRGDDRADRRRL